MRKIKFVFNRINDTHVSGHIELDEDMSVYFVICRTMPDQMFGYSIINEKVVSAFEMVAIESRLENLAEQWWHTSNIYFVTPSPANAA